MLLHELPAGLGMLLKGEKVQPIFAEPSVLLGVRCPKAWALMFELVTGPMLIYGVGSPTLFDLLRPFCLSPLEGWGTEGFS